MSSFSYSYSAIETFRSCPLKYKYQNIDKISTPKSPEAVFGTLIHSALKFAHEGGFLPPSEMDTLNYFSTNWNPKIFQGDQIQERVAFAQGIKIIQDYYKKNNLQELKIVALESRFSIILTDKDKKEQHLIAGTIDRIDKIEEEGGAEFEIIDYKTSRKLPSQETVEENWQLLIYLLAFLKRYPQYEKNPEKIKLSLYFLHHGVKLSTFKNKAQLETGKQTILEEIKKIATSDFPPLVSSLCDWCGYQKICPMWRHKFEKKEEENLDEEKIIENFIQLREKAKEIKSQIAENQLLVLKLMEKRAVERLFGSGKIIAKTIKKTYRYDEEKLKKILNELGLWESVLKINEARLKKVLETLPPKIKKMVEETKLLDKESFSLTIKKG